ncbi:NAD(P)-dependent oxidoreductase [Amycolatopsis rubida]|uniref:NAD(P)-dependent oxidoreductase n=1 Tax=Amycolatopsis rubida TaxID=112413 RepID=A0ABX0C498_9PSEU|nr:MULTISPECIES: NAD(P)-dependent oxidoreductase [Amycolatopsis]MYW96092.1 NAD-dependent epimerase/dehydratase family protein [Amycolatopsis rubida]NEC61083.1 NAD(P)-dependent oxidoreductase [Amycolatopsis rubida]OAP23397.1 putative epimerase/dehydratase [Amycolatopsis sp. M39]
MAVMVTGIGHAGSYVVRDLLAAGEKVVLFGLFGGPGGPDAPTPDLHVLKRIIGDDYADRTEIVVGDIRDLDALSDTMRTHGVTKAVHMASMLSAAVEANPPLAIQVNAVGTANVFEAAARLKLKKVVWASSMDVFGHGPAYAGQTISDESVYDPPYLYGATKVFNEYLARQYARNHGLSITGLRLSRIYGYGEHIKASRGSGTSWLSSLLYDPAIGNDVEVVVPFGARSMDFVYIEDVADACLKALAHTEPGSRDYLTLGEYRPIKDAYDFVRRVFPAAPVRLDENDAPLPPGSSMTWAVRHDGSRAAAEIGYAPRIRLEEGLLRTINANRADAGLPPVAAPNN